MNERNVAEIYKIVMEVWAHENTTALDMAQHLAARGVLVPSALTFDELTTVYAAAVTEGIGSDTIVGALERIAKGETPHG